MVGDGEPVADDQSHVKAGGVAQWPGSPPIPCGVASKTMLRAAEVVRVR